jgi:hypothetical protein
MGEGISVSLPKQKVELLQPKPVKENIVYLLTY